MLVKDVLEPLVNGTAVELVDFGDIVKRGTAFSLFTELPERYKEADVDMITVYDDVVKLFIRHPVTTNFDKLKELFPDIKREDNDYSDISIIKGLDISTRFRSDWLDTEYTGKDNE